MKPSHVIANEGLFPTIFLIRLSPLSTPGEYAKLGNMNNGDKDPRQHRVVLFP